MPRMGEVLGMMYKRTGKQATCMHTCAGAKCATPATLKVVM